MAVPMITQAISGNILIGIGFIVTGIYMYRRYRGVGVRSLSAFASSWGAVLLLANTSRAVDRSMGFSVPAVPPTVDIQTIILAVAFGLLMIAPISWASFVLHYTGQVGRRETLALTTLAVGVPLIALVFGLISAVSETVGYVVPTTVSDVLGPALILALIFINIGVIVGGSTRLYRASQRFRPLSRNMTATLIGCLLLPLTPLVLSSFIGFVRDQLLIELLGNGLGLGCLWLAVGYYGVFDHLPAASAVGRDTTVDNFNAGVVVLDDQRRITDLNGAAETLFETPPDAAIEASLEALLPESADTDAVWETGRTVFEIPDQNRIIEAETTISTDESGRELGRTIICYDITQRRRRQQRIEVLNRVLRHNLRNELDVVSGYSQLLTDGGVDTVEYAQKIDSQVTELVDLGDTAREIEEMLEAEPKRDDPVDLSSLIEQTIERVTSDSDASITTNISADVTVYANPTILQPVLREILENAIEHNDTDHPEVNVMVRDAGVTIVVSDNGPGIPTYEVEVFESGEETPLKHGSGLGLWLVKWGIDRLGGEVAFDTDSGGTRVTITLPETMVHHQSG